MDLYLPLNYRPLVVVGQTVIGGETIISNPNKILEITKTLYDNRMELSLLSMMDQDHSGKLIEMGLGYDINESLKSYLAVSKIIGDNSQDEEYTFTQMEDFSHVRLELKYFY